MVILKKKQKNIKVTPREKNVYYLKKNTNTGMAAEMTDFRWYACHSVRKIQSVHQPDNEVLGPQCPILLKYRTKNAISTADPVPLCLVSISQLLGVDCISEPTLDIYKICKYVHMNVALSNAVCPNRQKSWPIFLKNTWWCPQCKYPWVPKAQSCTRNSSLKTKNSANVTIFTSLTSRNISIVK